jgi:hypothetical protein
MSLFRKLKREYELFLSQIPWIKKIQWFNYNKNPQKNNYIIVKEKSYISLPYIDVRNELCSCLVSLPFIIEDIKVEYYMFKFKSLNKIIYTSSIHSTYTKYFKCIKNYLKSKDDSINNDLIRDLFGELCLEMMHEVLVDSTVTMTDHLEEFFLLSSHFFASSKISYYVQLINEYVYLRKKFPSHINCSFFIRNGSLDKNKNSSLLHVIKNKPEELITKYHKKLYKYKNILQICYTIPYVNQNNDWLRFLASLLYVQDYVKEHPDENINDKTLENFRFTLEWLKVIPVNQIIVINEEFFINTFLKIDEKFKEMTMFYDKYLDVNKKMLHSLSLPENVSIKNIVPFNMLSRKMQLTSAVNLYKHELLISLLLIFKLSIYFEQPNMSIEVDVTMNVSQQITGLYKDKTNLFFTSLFRKLKKNPIFLGCIPDYSNGLRLETPFNWIDVVKEKPHPVSNSLFFLRKQ